VDNVIDLVECGVIPDQVAEAGGWLQSKGLSSPKEGTSHRLEGRMRARADDFNAGRGVAAFLRDESGGLRLPTGAARWRTDFAE
jgi:hypothetical protein